jgi:hypothetical protein
VQPAIRSGFVEPLNLDLLPNLKDQFESMQTLDINHKDGQMYAACIFWGTGPMTVSGGKLLELHNQHVKRQRLSGA